MRVTTFGVLAAVKAEAGDIAAAEPAGRQAERLIADYGFGAVTDGVARASPRAGWCYEQRGEHEAADAAYTRAALLAGRAGWVLDEAHVLLAHAAFKRRRRDVAGARALVREARRAWRPVWTRCAGGAARGRRAGAAGGLVRARAVGADAELSEREVAVLRLLATDLSQREIGSAALRLVQHRQEPHAHALPQARRDEPGGRRRARTRPGSPVVHPG